MELKHLTLAVVTALGLSTTALAQTGDMGKRGAASDTTTATGSSSMGGAAMNDDVRQVQQELQNRGYNPGPIDGVMGPQTKSALKDFQQSEGLPASGELNQNTKGKLMAGGSGSSSGSPGASGKSGMGGSSSTTDSPSTRGSSANPNAPSVNGSDTQGASSPANPGSAPRGGSAGSGVKGSPSPNAGGTTAAPQGTSPRPSTDKPKTGDSSK